MTHARIVSVDSDRPDSQTILEAGEIIRQNGVVIFPAKCLYGVAAKALDPKAVKKVFNLKQRPKDKPILVLVPDRSHLQKLVKSIPDDAVKLMDMFWPGSLTIVFEAREHIPELLTASTGKIGIRVPIHPVARALVQNLNYPITGTSANISGQESCSHFSNLNPAILDSADLVLDAGELKGGKGSSIVDVTQFPPAILREGEIPSKLIHQALEG